MIKNLLSCFIITIFASLCFGQDTTNKIRYTKSDSTIHNPVLRFAVGTQKSAYLEAGLSWHSCIYGEGHFYSESGFYTSVEWTPTVLPLKDKNIFGFKAGIEQNGFIAMAFEVKYQTDGTLNDFVMTPKVGISPQKFCHLYLGYNISTNKYPFSDLQRVQLSLLFDLHRKVFRKTHNAYNLDQIPMM